MKIHVVAVAYERPIKLRILIDCFLIQTNDNWTLSIIYDGPVPKDVQQIINGYDDTRVMFYQSEKRLGNYGHPNRKQMLEKLIGRIDDYVLLTNDDNYYVPTYVESMLKMCNRRVGLVSCNTVHSHFAYGVHESRLVECGIDMGAFIVKYPIAKTIGFNHIHFSADGCYAQECADYCKRYGYKIVHIPKCYFVHN